VSAQFYDGRLVSADGCESQCLTVTASSRGSQALSGAGLRYLPVARQGNRTQSCGEAEVVTRTCSTLIGARWTTLAGARAPVREDIFVVAPYNRQVELLGTMVPEGVRVRTVDQFKRQEAPVVIYSLAASDASDASRGLTFLLDLRRMNGRCRAPPVW
jgi:uncharacterized protein